MFSLHRVKGRDNNAAKPFAPAHLGRKKQYYLLQLLKHCYRQTGLVQAGSGEKPGATVCAAVKWSSEDRRSTASLDAKARVSTLTFSGLQHSHSATYFCAMSTQCSPDIVDLYPNLHLALQASLKPLVVWLSSI